MNFLLLSLLLISLPLSAISGDNGRGLKGKKSSSSSSSSSSSWCPHSFEEGWDLGDFTVVGFTTTDNPDNKEVVSSSGDISVAPSNQTIPFLFSFTLVPSSSEDTNDVSLVSMRNGEELQLTTLESISREQERKVEMAEEMGRRERVESVVEVKEVVVDPITRKRKTVIRRKAIILNENAQQDSSEGLTLGNGQVFQALYPQEDDMHSLEFYLYAVCDLENNTCSEPSIEEFILSDMYCYYDNEAGWYYCSGGCW